MIYIEQKSDICHKKLFLQINNMHYSVFFTLLYYFLLFAGVLRKGARI